MDFSTQSAIISVRQRYLFLTIFYSQLIPKGLCVLMISFLPPTKPCTKMSK